MTDKELSAFGESLYEAVLFTPVPAGTIFGLANAIRQNVPWAQLPRHLKFAVFRIAANCTGEAGVSGAEPPAPEPTVPPQSSGPTPETASVNPEATTAPDEPAPGETDAG